MMDKNLPARGKNGIDVVVTDAISKPVTDAQVHIEYLMPSFPGRKPMTQYRTMVKTSGDHYKAQVDLSQRTKS